VCQTADWKAHKTTCRRLKTRKSFYRAGELLQEVFYLYREKLFDKLIDRIEHRDGKMYIHEGRYSQLLTEYDRLVPFPTSLCQDSQDKKALLAHISCDDAVAWLGDITKHILEGNLTR
jgi:hypothetical protein